MAIRAPDGAKKNFTKTQQRLYGEERQRERGTGEAGKTTKKSYKRDMSINKKMIYDL